MIDGGAGAVIGILSGLLVLIAYCIGYMKGKKEGEEKGVVSCAKTSVDLMKASCCPYCWEKIKENVDEYMKLRDMS